MIFKSVTVGELPDFIASGEYRRCEIIPITSHRALSQFKNPAADNDDIALILAYENDELLGYVGSLPDRINNEKVFWNSCWWVDPRKGGKVALPLFYKFLLLTKSRVLLKGLTPHTQLIIEKTGLFKTIKPIRGNRFFLRFYLHQLISGKKTFSKYFSFLFYPLDFIVNGILITIQSFTLFFDHNNASYRIIREIDYETNDFIKKHNATDLIKREKEELNWIIKNPWVLRSDEYNKAESEHYPFSSVAKSFEYHILKIYRTDNLVGLIVLSARNRHFKTLMCYFDTTDTTLVAKEIRRFLYKNNALSFLTFNNDLNKLFKENSLVYYHKITITEDLVVANELIPTLPASFTVQDGDGDSIFV
jgi:hypothetical protein